MGPSISRNQGLDHCFGREDNHSDQFDGQGEWDNSDWMNCRIRCSNGLPIDGYGPIGDQSAHYLFHSLPGAEFRALHRRDGGNCSVNTVGGVGDPDRLVHLVEQAATEI